MGTPREQAEHVASVARSHEAGAGPRRAVEEMQEDLKHLTPAQRREFFAELVRQDRENGHLPGLEITGDEQHHNRRVGVTGQAPVYEESGAISRGKGPYDATRSQHPDWSPEQVAKEAHRINQQTGRHAYKEGEQIIANKDGSVTLRTEDKNHPGEYSETRYKDGEAVSTRKSDGHGGWTQENFEHGQVTSRVKHEVGANGGDYTETTTKPNGEKINEKTRKVGEDGTYVEKSTNYPSGNFVQTNYDVDGNPQRSWERTYPGTDRNVYTETRKDGSGTVTSTMDRKADPRNPGWYIEVKTPHNADGPREAGIQQRSFKGADDSQYVGYSLRYESNEDPDRLPR